ncbi:MAG: hypothetical protein K6U12_04425 [Armatimonadetes bacterium]|nr:hypothetical protein [Armatimonadota bacterium]CUU35533.1 hypothetical protein DCOP10_114273 [Armatimonadetes bacterium DC]
MNQPQIVPVLKTLIVYLGDSVLYYFTAPFAVRLESRENGTLLTVMHDSGVRQFVVGKDLINTLACVHIGEVEALEEIRA